MISSFKINWVFAFTKTITRIFISWQMSLHYTPNVQSAPAELDPPALPPVSKDDARFRRFLRPVTCDLWPFDLKIDTPLIRALFCVALFSSYEPVRDRRTDGRARCAMRPTERPHNNSIFTYIYIVYKVLCVNCGHLTTYFDKGQFIYC